MQSHAPGNVQSVDNPLPLTIECIKADRYAEMSLNMFGVGVIVYPYWFHALEASVALFPVPFSIHSDSCLFVLSLFACAPTGVAGEDSAARVGCKVGVQTTQSDEKQDTAGAKIAIDAEIGLNMKNGRALIMNQNL